MRISTISGTLDSALTGVCGLNTRMPSDSPSAHQMRVQLGNENNSRLPPSRVSATMASLLLHAPLFLFPSKPVMVPFVAAR